MIHTRAQGNEEWKEGIEKEIGGTGGDQGQAGKQGGMSWEKVEVGGAGGGDQPPCSPMELPCGGDEHHHFRFPQVVTIWAMRFKQATNKTGKRQA